MNAHPLLRQLLIITFISGAVLLSFKYVLPLIFPFLFAYTLMRSLMPIVLFLQKKCHLPKWLAANGTLLLISLAFLGVFLLIGWLLFQQCKLLLTNLSIYHQIYTKSIESCCHNILQHSCKALKNTFPRSIIIYITIVYKKTVNTFFK